MSKIETVAAEPGGGLPAAGERRGPRAWRVGSLSMGVALMLIGTALAVSLWQGTQVYEMLLWVAPIVFILLGVELLLHLRAAASSQSVVRFDWVSVFFVGCMGLASLVLSLIMSTGLFDELQRGMNMRQHTMFVDPEQAAVQDHIEKIVVQTTSGLTIYETSADEVALTGQVTYWSSEEREALKGNLLQTKMSGTTMFVMVGSVGGKTGGFFPDELSSKLILTVPEGVLVERSNF